MILKTKDKILTDASMIASVSQKDMLFLKVLIDIRNSLAVLAGNS